MKPQLLYLVHRVPYPPNRGDRIRSFHLLKFLAAHYDVSLACLADEPLEPGTAAALDRYCRRVAIVKLHRPTRWLRAAWSLATGGSASTGLFRSPLLHSRISRWCAGTRFDAVLTFCSSMAPYLKIRQLARTSLVVDLVDVDSQKFQDYAATSTGLKRRLFQLEASRLRWLEQDLGRRARAVTLVSEPEADLYRAFAGGARVYAISNGVDLDYYTPRPAGQDAASSPPPKCVFVGALDYRANIDGVTWFCQNVWARVRAARPGAEFAMVGRQPTSAVRHLAEQPGVTIAADVPDVRPYVWGADVIVAPLRIARGIQNKVVEALACGKPVVASPEACEGLHADSAECLLRAASPEEWTAQILRLLDNPPLAQELGKAGRIYTEHHHDWSTCLAPFLPLLSQKAVLPAQSTTYIQDRSSSDVAIAAFAIRND